MSRLFLIFEMFQICHKKFEYFNILFLSGPEGWIHGEHSGPPEEMLQTAAVARGVGEIPGACQVDGI